MPRRRLVVRAVLAAGLVWVAGCRARVAPVSSAPPAGPATAGAPGPVDRGAGPAQPVAAIPVRPAQPAVRIAPAEATLTAGDPGLQLLAAGPAEPAADR